jgi:hypothetical protein
MFGLIDWEAFFTFAILRLTLTSVFLKSSPLKIPQDCSGTRYFYALLSGSLAQQQAFLISGQALTADRSEQR